MILVADEQQVRGVPTIHCGFETFEGFHRRILPSIPFLFPAKRLNLDEPVKSRHLHMTLMSCKRTLITRIPRSRMPT
jgi:hypothetical protein